MIVTLLRWMRRSRYRRLRALTDSRVRAVEQAQDELRARLELVRVKAEHCARSNNDRGGIDG